MSIVSSPKQERPTYIGEGSAAIGRAFELLKDDGHEDGAIELLLRGCRKVGLNLSLLALCSTHELMSV